MTENAGCGISVQKERECGIRTPLPDPENSTINVIHVRYCLFYEARFEDDDSSSDDQDKKVSWLPAL